MELSVGFRMSPSPWPWDDQDEDSVSSGLAVTMSFLRERSSLFVSSDILAIVLGISIKGALKASSRSDLSTLARAVFGHRVFGSTLAGLYWPRASAMGTPEFASGARSIPLSDLSRGALNQESSGPGSTHRHA